MVYCYSYEEQWQLKDIPVIFRMYQPSFDGNIDYVWKKYWEMYHNHFAEHKLLENSSLLLAKKA